MVEKDDAAVTALSAEFASLRSQLDDNDKQNIVVAVLAEEFKARWHQLIELDNDVNKWMSSYVIGLVVGISWILGSEHVGDIKQFYSGRNNDNSYFILSLALINGAYILALSFKGYQIQQLRYYIYVKICKPLSEIVKMNVHSWERWHRSIEFCSARRIGKPEWRRLLYYPVITILPFAVSVFIAVSYVNYVGRYLSWSDRHNCYFYFVMLLQLFALVLSASTSGFNRRWMMVIKDEESADSFTNDKADSGRKRSEAGSLNKSPSNTPKGSSLNNPQEEAWSSGSQIQAGRKVDNHSIVAAVFEYSILVGFVILAFRNSLKRKDSDRTPP